MVMYAVLLCLIDSRWCWPGSVIL